MFGAYQFGQSFFGEGPGILIVAAPNCGGMWGTATFGSPYFGQHIQCGTVPPPPPPPTPSWGGWHYDRKHHRNFEWRRWYPQQQENRNTRKGPPKKAAWAKPSEVIEVLEAVAYGAGLSTSSAVGTVFFRTHGVARVSGVEVRCNVGYVATRGIGDAEALGFASFSLLGNVDARGDCYVAVPGFIDLSVVGKVSIKTIHNPSDEELILMILQADEDSA